MSYFLKIFKIIYSDGWRKKTELEKAYYICLIPIVCCVLFIAFEIFKN